jgi:hypothetical protein
MEYLDGCTLGDVLAEEKRLPLEWLPTFSIRFVPPFTKRINRESFIAI